MLTITRLTVENQARDCLTDDPHPIFTYALSSDRQNVLVRQATLEVNGWTLRTDRQTGLRYEGPALMPHTRYPVRLTVTDDAGESACAETCFTTGFLGEAWQAQWITDGTYHFKEKKVSPQPMTFRKQFTLSGPVRSAVLYATALGIYELTLNGQKVGQDYFAPGFTSYHYQMQYQAYQIASGLLRENCLQAVVAGGWAVGAYTYKRCNRLYAKRQAFLCELHLTYADGSSEVIATGPDWQVTREGPLQAAEFYNGEIYDAPLEGEPLHWHGATPERLDFHPRLLAEYGAPVRAHEELHPVSCTTAPGGMLIYDMGQNFAGVIRAKMRGRRGQKVCFTHAEILMDGTLYTAPLRSAAQQLVYICRDGEQEYSPRMTYMGFRYVGVTGIDAKDLELSAWALYSDLPENGSFTCSYEPLNKMQSCIQWGAKSNFVDIPTDCPQRDERLGWTGDIALFSPTAAWNFDTSRFFDKWLMDVQSEQTRGGGIPMIVPKVRIPGQFEMLFPQAVDHWGDACILVPLAEYRARGNIELLRRMYPTMKRYLKACRFWAGLFSFGQHRYIWKLLFHYGDWCAPDTGFSGWLKRGKWTATACMAYSARLVADVAALLGEAEDAARFRAFAQKTAKAYRDLLMQSDASVKPEFQTAYVLPLYYGLLNGEDRKKAAAHLVRLVRQGNYHIRTGFPGTPYILFALADNGYLEDAYKMLLNDTCPSWLYEIKTGATTFWERWDALREDGSCNQGEENGSGGMVSFNHYVCGAVGDFLYRRIAGIEPREGGYRTLQIAPKPGGSLTWAQGSVNTPYGRVASRWQHTDGIFRLEVEIPAGTRAAVVMPSGKTYHIGSGQWTYQEELA